MIHDQEEFFGSLFFHLGRNPHLEHVSVQGPFNYLKVKKDGGPALAEWARSMNPVKSIRVQQTIGDTAGVFVTGTVSGQRMTVWNYVRGGWQAGEELTVDQLCTGH